MPHTRRALLAAVAVGLAGCSTDPGTGADGGSEPYRTTTAPRTTATPGTAGSDEGTPATTPTEDTPDAGGTTTDAEAMATAGVEVDVAAAFGSYFYREGPELLAVAGGGEQYLIAELSVPEGVAPAAAEFAVESGGAAYPMTYEPRGTAPDGGAFDRGESYSEGGSGWLAAALASSLPAAPVVTLRERSWPVPDGPARRLTDQAPSFTVASFETPGRVRPGASYSVELTVRNGGGAGIFRAALNWAGERTVTTVEQEVPAGGRLRWRGGTDVPPGDATAMALVTPGHRIERTVAVER